MSNIINFKERKAKKNKKNLNEMMANYFHAFNPFADRESLLTLARICRN